MQQQPKTKETTQSVEWRDAIHYYLIDMACREEHLVYFR